MRRERKLSRRSRRSYVEAIYRRAHFGASSEGWRGSEYDVEIWLHAMTLADQEENVTPWDALLLAVKRRAARVRWADQVAEHAMKAHRESCAELGEGDPDIPPSEVRTWLAESRNEERLMTRAAKMAVDAGVADAMIRRVEHEGKMISEIWLAGIDAIDLTQDQRVKALSAMHAMLARLGPKMPSPIDGNVIDMPPLDGD